MTTTTRHIALAATVVGLVAGLLVADHATRQPNLPAVPADARNASAAVGRDGLDRAPTAAQATQIARTAREFLDAYLPYTHGDPAGLAALQPRVASPGLTDRLLARAPHTTRREARPEVVRAVRVERLTDHDAIALAQISGPGGDYAIALTVHRDRAGRWSVVDTRPAG